MGNDFLVRVQTPSRQGVCDWTGDQGEIPALLYLVSLFIYFNYNISI